MLKNIKNLYVNTCQRLNSAFVAPTQKQAQVVMFVFGAALLLAGLSMEAAAYSGSGAMINYNDERIADATNAILTYIEGTFGAMIMVGAGLMAILSAALGGYKAALSLLIVAVGAFILRSLVGTFFNDVNIQD